MCWPNEKWWLTEGFFLSKMVCFVWINRYVQSLFSKFHGVLTKSQFSFFGQLLNCNSDWPKKISIYSLQKALLTKSCQLFTFLFIHTKCTFSITMRLFCRELAGKSSPSCARFYYFTDFGSLRFTMCHVVRLKRWFFHLVNAILAVWILKIFKHIYPLETSMQITTYLWLWRIWF